MDETNVETIRDERDSQSDNHRQIDELLSIPIVKIMREGRALLKDLFYKSKISTVSNALIAFNSISAKHWAAEDILTSSHSFFTLDTENQPLIVASINEMNTRLNEYRRLLYYIYDEQRDKISCYILIMTKLVDSLVLKSINQGVKYPNAPTNVETQFGYAGIFYSQNNDHLESSVDPATLPPSQHLSSNSDSSIYYTHHMQALKYSNYQAVLQKIYEQSYATSTHESIQLTNEQFRYNEQMRVEQPIENQGQSFNSGQMTDTASTIPHHGLAPAENYQPVQQPPSTVNNVAEECREPMFVINNNDNIRDDTTDRQRINSLKSKIRTSLNKLLSGKTGGGRRVKKPPPNASSCEKWLYEARKMKGQRKERTQSYSNNESKKTEQNDVKKGNKQDFAARNKKEHLTLVKKKKELEKKHAGQLNNIDIRTLDEQIIIEETIREIEECRSCMKEISSLLPKEEYALLCDERKQSALNAKMYRMKQLLKVERLRNEIRALWIEDGLL